MRRQRDNPGIRGGGADYNTHGSSLGSTSAGALKALNSLFPNNSHVGSDYGSPNDFVWRDAAGLGTYTYVDDSYSRSEYFHIPTSEFNVITVEDNYVTQVVNLSRDSGSDEFNVSSVTSFEIEKGEVQTKEVKTWWGGTRTKKYRTLTVTETTQQYKNNKATGKATSKTYEREERVR